MPTDLTHPSRLVSIYYYTTLTPLTSPPLSFSRLFSHNTMTRKRLDVVLCPMRYLDEPDPPKIDITINDKAFADRSHKLHACLFDVDNIIHNQHVPTSTQWYQLPLDMKWTISLQQPYWDVYVPSSFFILHSPFSSLFSSFKFLHVIILLFPCLCYLYLDPKA